MTPAQLVAYSRAALGAPYWYACYGQTSTMALLNYKRQQYPKQYTAARVAKCSTQLGRRVWDCVGLIKGAFWDMYFAGRYHVAEDLSADGMFLRCTQTGPMSTLPEIPGLVLHFPGHIAIYEGKGQCIEERGFASGCVRSPIAGRGFTAWGKCHLVDYREDDMLEKGSTGPAVGGWQRGLIALGVPMIGADGKTYGADESFGTATVNGTNKFLASVGLPLTGTVNDVAWAKMADALRAKVQIEDTDCHAAQALVTAQAEQLKKLQEELAGFERLSAEDAKITDALRILAARVDAPVT